MESLIRNFIKNMSKEEKQRMMQQFMDSLSEEEKTDIIGLSALLTMTVDHVGEVVELLKEKGIRQDFKIIVGGACVTDEIAKKLGCDAFGRNAIVAVDVCRKLL